jgi:hypothetical protein
MPGIEPGQSSPKAAAIPTGQSRLFMAVIAAIIIIIIIIIIIRFFSAVQYSYFLALPQLKLHTLRMRRHHPDALFLI